MSEISYFYTSGYLTIWIVKNCDETVIIFDETNGKNLITGTLDFLRIENILEKILVFKKKKEGSDHQDRIIKRSRITPMQ